MRAHNDISAVKQNYTRSKQFISDESNLYALTTIYQRSITIFQALPSSFHFYFNLYHFSNKVYFSKNLRYTQFNAFHSSQNVPYMIEKWMKWERYTLG